MELKINAFMQQDPSGGYIAWIDDSKKLKMLVHGETPEEATSELIISLKVSLSYLLDIKIDSIKRLTDEEYLTEITKSLKTNGKRELTFLAA